MQDADSDQPTPSRVRDLLGHPQYRPRPKIMERRPDPPPLTTFAVDEGKLRSVLPPPESFGLMDLRMVLWIFGAIGLLFASVVLLAFALLRWYF